MELEGAKRCFQFLEQLGLTITVFISDRHRGIAKWIREVCVKTTHYYDIWHVARSVTKKLLHASKEKGCEIIKDWMKGIRRHLYWSATSTKPGFGSLILAKWNSFMRHVSNKHGNHPDPLYKECHHNNLEPRKWIKVGEFVEIVAVKFVINTGIPANSGHVICDFCCKYQDSQKTRHNAFYFLPRPWPGLMILHCTFPTYL